jgi:hypothetical protein
VNRYTTISLAIAAALVLAACQSTGRTSPGGAGDAPGPGAGMPSGTEAALAPSLPGAPTPASTTGVPSLDNPPAPMVASGQVTLVPRTPVAEPTRPQPKHGFERAVPLDEAIAALPYQILAPKTLPENSKLALVRLITPLEGETDPSLPGVRVVYDLDVAGTIFLYETPATGAPGEGDPVKVGDRDAWERTNGDTTILTFEQDNVRVELRGIKVERDVLMAAAESLAPIEAP